MKQDNYNNENNIICAYNRMVLYVHEMITRKADKALVGRSMDSTALGGDVEGARVSCRMEKTVNRVAPTV